MDLGYIKLWRRISENPLWTEEKFTRGQAWVDLLILASHKDQRFRKRGIRVDQPRGTVGVSVLGLASRWQWSRGKVQRFLDELEMAQQIVQQKSRLTTLIKIVNYDLYQGNGTTDRATNRTTNGQQTDTIKNVKNVKKETSTPPTPPLEIPDWIDPVLWKDFKEFRQKIKAPLTNRAVTGILNKLKKFMEAGDDPNQVIEQSIERGWRGIFPVKENGNGKKKRRSIDAFQGKDYGAGTPDDQLPPWMRDD